MDTSGTLGYDKEGRNDAKKHGNHHDNTFTAGLYYRLQTTIRVGILWKGDARQGRTAKKHSHRKN